jgi:hypothetical protein
MNEMKIDLRVIRGWVGKWQEDDGVTRTASKLAAVMLSEVLRENEKRLITTETVMSEILNESRTLENLERQLLARLKARRGLDAEIEEQLRGHRRRMAALLKEADEVMMRPSTDLSVKVGGLLFEISRNASRARTPSDEPAKLQA